MLWSYIRTYVGKPGKGQTQCFMFRHMHIPHASIHTSCKKTYTLEGGRHHTECFVVICQDWARLQLQPLLTTPLTCCTTAVPWPGLLSQQALCKIHHLFWNGRRASHLCRCGHHKLWDQKEQVTPQLVKRTCTWGETLWSANRNLPNHPHPGHHALNIHMHHNLWIPGIVANKLIRNKANSATAPHYRAAGNSRPQDIFPA